MPFPGWLALIPTFGAALVISAGVRSWANRRLLSLHPIVFLGIISYPLYLWHWPLLALTRLYHGSDLQGFGRIILAFVAFCLLFLTYKVFVFSCRVSTR